MDAYPVEYVELNLPLVLLSGLGVEDQKYGANIQPKLIENGTRIQTESPEVGDGRSKQLLQGFKALDGTHNAWNSAALPGPTGVMRFKMRAIGRSYVLPPQKAAPQSQSPGTEGTPVSRPSELHSPLSPMSPGSPIFPDGVFTPLWFSKHQDQVPCLLIAFFSLDAEDSGSCDEAIKSDILTIRAALNRSGYRTRFAAILMSDKSILQSPELEERLASIRKAASLDTKTGLFFMPPMTSQGEIVTFAQSVMSTLQPGCVEFYRDLSKHARRKKGRGSLTSPISGVFQSTLPSGWSVRYELKQGVFAEFRQEMDVAQGHYIAAVEELFSSGGIFETTAGWSPQFNDARLLCDIMALRALRCQLWNGATTTATQFWLSYKHRTRDLIDRRGKGSATYSWDAWEVRWASTMAQFIQLAEVPHISKPRGQISQGAAENIIQQVFVVAEKTVADSERLLPFHYLHRSAYWLRLLANGIRSRWDRCADIPDEDRIPPGQSPASAVANRSKNYDTYLVPQPHEESPLSGTGSLDYASELGEVCARAAEHFESNLQTRMSEEVRLDLAQDLVRAERYDDAVVILAQLWEKSSWRGEDWHGQLHQLLTVGIACARRSKAPQASGLIPAMTWELLSVAASIAPPTSLDIATCINDREAVRPTLLLRSNDRLSPVQPTFAFRTRQTHVGDSLHCQLVLQYLTSADSGTLHVSRINLTFSASRRVRIQHEPASDRQAGSTVLSQASEVREDDEGTLMTSDLSLRPSQKRIVEISLNLREAHTFQLTQLEIFVENEKFALVHQYDDDAILPSQLWYAEKKGVVDSAPLPHLDVRSVEVWPKPPKMKIDIGLRKVYYTSEKIRVPIELANEESETVNATIIPSVVGKDGESLRFSWTDSHDFELARRLPSMEPSATERLELTVLGPSQAGAITLSIDLRYTLASDPDTPLSKTLEVELDLATPFEAKFTMAHLLHCDPWPSYFDPTANGSADLPGGVIQLWRLLAPIKSLAEEALTLRKLEMMVERVEGEAAYEAQNGSATSERRMGPGALHDAGFEYTTQKFALDDRRPTHVELSLAITWSRGAESQTSTLKIPAPRFTILASEPRALCTVAEGAASGGRTIVHYHLENPSIHFLTFALTMEASEEFAFSGPKYRTLSVAPLSRHRVDYHLLLPDEDDGQHPGEAEGVWISPTLQIVDSYFQKNLRIYAGGKHVKLNEKKDLSVWISRK